MQSELQRILLKNRGIETDVAAEAFLNPNYSVHTHDPFLMIGMEKAVDRIYKAIREGEHTVIYSDYDCDGIPGAVVLHDLFKKINYENFTNYIPDRHNDGYGLHHEALEVLASEAATLIITVDLGITAVAEVAWAQEKGIDIIITDHHVPHDTLPEAFAILNPKLKGNTYPFKDLCGAGVAFKLVQAFVKKYGAEFNISGDWEKWLLDMVGLATLSDMVPLVGENRIFSYYGLIVLKKTKRPGLVALYQKMKLTPRYMTEDDITFMITPRLNAASRMDSPHHAFDLLRETDPVRAEALATHLTKINDSRKTTVATIMKEVHKMMSTREDKPLVVIGNPSWRPGVLGLIAAKIVETYGKPAFVWGGNDDEAQDILKGSCRSDGSVNIVDLMTISKDAFASFGGHELAGGFTVNREQVHDLEQSLVVSYQKIRRNNTVRIKPYILDHELPLEHVSNSVYQELLSLAPFGLGNPKPVFTFSVEVESARTFGKTGEHLELIVINGKSRKKAIAFFSTPDTFEVQVIEGKKVNLIAHIELSYFMGREELRLRIVDIV